jgi:hypothetical protein
MQNRFDETTYFHYARRIDGRLESVDCARHNGRLVPRFDPSWTDVACGGPADDSEFEELIAELSYNLNAAESRTWLKLIDGQSVEHIAQTEGVSRAAVYERIRGNSKNQGGMVKKNDYVRLWWNLRQASR